MFATAISVMCWTEWYGLLIPVMMSWFVSYMIGIGGVIFLYCSEILPPSGASFTWAFHWGTAAMTGKFSVLAVDSFGTGYVFMFYGLITLIISVVIGLWVRETKDKSLKEIE